MGRKDTLFKQLAINQSLAANFISPITVVRNTDNVCYQVVITTSNSTGTFTIQASLDYAQANGTVTNPGNWSTLPLGNGNPSANAINDQIIIDLIEIPFNAIRLVYTSVVSGTGTCNIWIATKQQGG